MLKISQIIIVLSAIETQLRSAGAVAGAEPRAAALLRGRAGGLWREHNAQA